MTTVMVAACSNPRAPVSEGTSGGSSSSSGGGTTLSSSTTSVDDSTSTTTLASSDDTDGCPFVCSPDVHPDIDECDALAQDCPAGEKCVFYWEGGYDHTHCIPIAEDPAAIGEPCTVEGEGLASVDDCDAGSMCIFVDARTQLGTCYAMCEGTPASIYCSDPAYQCAVASSAFAICLLRCDPVAGDCPTGDVCRPENNGFACLPDASSAMGSYGEACEDEDECASGLFCANPDVVPGCTGTPGCCNAYCDLEAMDPDAMCPGAAQGQTCAPWYDIGEPPAGLEHVGVCTVVR